jgi:hypothetical protein
MKVPNNLIMKSRPFLALLVGGLIIWLAVLYWSSITFFGSHGDERIALEVVKYIVNENTLDTNWNNVKSLGVFNYP